MTDTYDKENFWFGWNGGECPLHPETEVFFAFRDYDDRMEVFEGFAKRAPWQCPGGFRITKLYREPRKAREWWINVYPDDLDSCSYTTREKADQEHASNRIECIHVREVLGDDDAH
jgi:hypothetical protein